MNQRKKDDLFMRAVVTIAVIFCLLIVGFGCSTVTGAGRFLQGVGADLEDAGEGTREHMSNRR